MANPLMGMMGSNSNERSGLSVNKFIQFANAYKGNPQAEVMKLLESGQMSRTQFEQLKREAQAFRQLLGK